jgi:hypothetical protein
MTHTPRMSRMVDGGRRSPRRCCVTGCARVPRLGALICAVHAAALAGTCDAARACGDRRCTKLYIRGQQCVRPVRARGRPPGNRHHGADLSAARAREGTEGAAGDADLGAVGRPCPINGQR